MWSPRVQCTYKWERLVLLNCIFLFIKKCGPDSIKKSVFYWDGKSTLWENGAEGAVLWTVSLWEFRHCSRGKPNSPSELVFNDIDSWHLLFLNYFTHKNNCHTFDTFCGFFSESDITNMEDHFLLLNISVAHCSPQVPPSAVFSHGLERTECSRGGGGMLFFLEKGEARPVLLDRKSYFSAIVASSAAFYFTEEQVCNAEFSVTHKPFSRWFKLMNIHNTIFCSHSFFK